MLRKSWGRAWPFSLWKHSDYPLSYMSRKKKKRYNGFSCVRGTWLFCIIISRIVAFFVYLCLVNIRNYMSIVLRYIVEYIFCKDQPVLLLNVVTILFLDCSMCFKYILHEVWFDQSNYWFPFLLLRFLFIEKSLDEG